jgi:glycine oxidase
MYPEYLDDLARLSGVRVPLELGLLEVPFTADEASSLRAMVREDSEWLDGGTLRQLEPALAPAEGAVLHRRDGAVDPIALLGALRAEAARSERIAFRGDRVAKMGSAGGLLYLEMADGTRVSGPSIVLAAGAWMARIEGLPRAIPVKPIRGQVLELAGGPIRHVVMASSGYIVPRKDRSLVGSTMEDVGFDSRATQDGASALLAIARQISAGLTSFRIVGHWAGLRPVTPDFQPIVGPDPEYPGLFYACGHSKNGVLLAPLTARIIAELVTTGTTSFDLAAYRPSRFAEGGR